MTADEIIEQMQDEEFYVDPLEDELFSPGRVTP